MSPFDNADAARCVAVSMAAESDFDKLRWPRDPLSEDKRIAAKFGPAAVTDPSVREAALGRVS